MGIDFRFWKAWLTSQSIFYVQNGAQGMGLGHGYNKMFFFSSKTMSKKTEQSMPEWSNLHHKTLMEIWVRMCWGIHWTILWWRWVTDDRDSKAWPKPFLKSGHFHLSWDRSRGRNSQINLWSLNLTLLSSSTTSCELLSQFSTCSGWRWFDDV